MNRIIRLLFYVPVLPLIFALYMFEGVRLIGAIGVSVAEFLYELYRGWVRRRFPIWAVRWET